MRFQYMESGEIDDLDKVLSVAQRTVQEMLTIGKYSDLAHASDNLAYLLHDQFKVVPLLRYIDEAIDDSERAVSLTDDTIHFLFPL